VLKKLCVLCGFRPSALRHSVHVACHSSTRGVAAKQVGRCCSIAASQSVTVTVGSPHHSRLVLRDCCSMPQNLLCHSMSHHRMPVVPPLVEPATAFVKPKLLTIAVMQCTASSPHAASGAICTPQVTSGNITTGPGGPGSVTPGGPVQQHNRRCAATQSQACSNTITGVQQHNHGCETV
jgi:hypothetical protein